MAMATSSGRGLTGLTRSRVGIAMAAWVRCLMRMMMNEEITVLDLFSGIGGFSLGLERAGPFRTVAFCEQDAYAQRVLKKHWPEVPIYDDVRTIDTNGLGKIDLICGGFPCQPWSVAGNQRGAEDDRDLWPAMVALVEELRPQWLIGENVRGFVNESLGLQRSLFDLESIGYQAVPFIIPACAVDAPHRRDRVWIVANADGGRQPRRGEHEEQSHKTAPTGQVIAHADGQSEPDGTQHEQRMVGDATSEGPYASAQARVHSGKKSAGTWDAELKRRGENVADTERKGEGRRGVSGPREDKNKNGKGSSGQLGGHGEAMANPKHQRHKERMQPKAIGNGSGQVPTEARPEEWWAVEPDVGRVAHGVPNRVDRLKCLGNAVVPQVVEQIGQAILAGEQR